MAWQKQLRARWQALGLREQRGLGLAAALVGAALLWSLGLAPALRTLHNAEAQNAQLSNAAGRMQALQARARLLQATPLTTRFSTISSSSQTMVPTLSDAPGSTKLDNTRKGTRWFMASSTERPCSTRAPREAISSISS